MKLQNLGDAGVWNFETLPYDFASQFPVSNQPFAVVVDQVAPGIVSYAQSIATAGETLLSAVLRARSSVSMNDAQRQLLDIQLQRAQAGLPPLDVSSITGGGRAGLTRSGPLVLGLIVAAVLLLRR